MSKDSHFTGQPVYSQVLKLLDKKKILQISRETKGSEPYVKRPDSNEKIWKQVQLNDVISQMPYHAKASYEEIE